MTPQTGSAPRHACVPTPLRDRGCHGTYGGTKVGPPPASASLWSFSDEVVTVWGQHSGATTPGWDSAHQLRPAGRSGLLASAGFLREGQRGRRSSQGVWRGRGWHHGTWSSIAGVRARGCPPPRFQGRGMLKFRNTQDDDVAMINIDRLHKEPCEHAWLPAGVEPLCHRRGRRHFRCHSHELRPADVLHVVGRSPELTKPWTPRWWWRSQMVSPGPHSLLWFPARIVLACRRSCKSNVARRMTGCPRRSTER